MDILLIEGPSGTGKTFGWRNVPVDESVIISPNTKSLSFGRTGEYMKARVKVGNAETSRLVRTDNLDRLPGAIQAYAQAGVRYILLEDFTHYFSAMIVSDDFMKQGSGNSAFERWKTFALRVFKVIKAAESIKPGQPGYDSILVIHHHVEQNEKLGLQSFKIFGKLLSDNIDPVSYFSTVLHSMVIPGKKGDEKYRYLINSDGIREAKCPPDVAKLLKVDEGDTIVNDTYEVLKALRLFNGFDEETNTTMTLEP